MKDRLFSLRLYGNDCERNPKFDYLRFRNLNNVTSNSPLHRLKQNTAVVTVNLDDLSTNIKNTIPVKPYDGKKRDHVFKYLERYLMKRVLLSNDVSEVIQKDFLQLIRLRKSSMTQTIHMAS